MVVGVHKILNVIYLAIGAAIGQIYSDPNFVGAVKSLYHNGVLIALTGKVLDVVTLY